MRVRGLQRGEKVTSAEDEDSDVVVEEVTGTKFQKPFQEQHRQGASLGRLAKRGNNVADLANLPSEAPIRALESVFLSCPLLTQAVTR